jgi:hypothetical protein
MSDPATQTYRNARREARFVLSVWLCALLWTVSYCYLHGYPHAPDSWLVRNGLATATEIGPSRVPSVGLAAVAGADVIAIPHLPEPRLDSVSPGGGMRAPAPIPEQSDLPSWIFWGIVVPAAICSAITLAYGLFGMRDDPLGADKEEPPA